MKITVAYIPEEQEEAAAVLAALRPLRDWEKIRKSKAHPPFRHIYFTTRPPVQIPRKAQDSHCI